MLLRRSLILRSSPCVLRYQTHQHTDRLCVLTALCRLLCCLLTVSAVFLSTVDGEDAALVPQRRAQGADVQEMAGLPARGRGCAARQGSQYEPSSDPSLSLLTLRTLERCASLLLCCKLHSDSVALICCVRASHCSASADERALPAHQYDAHTLRNRLLSRVLARCCVLARLLSASPRRTRSCCPHRFACGRPCVSPLPAWPCALCLVCCRRRPRAGAAGAQERAQSLRRAQENVRRVSPWSFLPALTSPAHTCLCALVRLRRDCVAFLPDFHRVVAAAPVRALPLCSIIRDLATCAVWFAVLCC